MRRKSPRDRADRVVVKTLADGTVKEYRYGPHEPKPDAMTDIAHTVAALVYKFEDTPKYDHDGRKGSLDLQTQQKYTHCNGRLIEALGKEDVKKVSRDDLMVVRNAILDRYGDGAAFNFAASTTMLFKFGQISGWVGVNPAVKLKEDLEIGEHKPWTREEVALALQYVSDPMYRVVRATSNLGQRLGDMVRLEWSWYWPERGTITIPAQEKTGQRVVIPLRPDFKVEVDAWHALYLAACKANREPPDPHILVDYKGAAWSKVNLRGTLVRELTQIEAKLGEGSFPMRTTKSGHRIPERTMHGLRYFVCCCLAESGCTVWQIMAITGHKTVKMVQKYCALYNRETTAEEAVALWAAGEAAKTATPTEQPVLKLIPYQDTAIVRPTPTV
jgi:integrase